MIASVIDASLPMAVLALGGGIGCAARAAARQAMASRGVSAPIAILGVNLLGAAAAGALVGALPHAAGEPGSFARPLALAVLSGWTTYSAFSADVLAAVRSRRPGRAAILWIGTIVAAPAIALAASRMAAGIAAGVGP